MAETKVDAAKKQDIEIYEVNKNNIKLQQYLSDNEIHLSMDCFIQILLFLPEIDIFKILYNDNYKLSFNRILGTHFQIWNIYLYSTKNTNDFQAYWNSIDLRYIFAWIYKKYKDTLLELRLDKQAIVDDWHNDIKHYDRQYDRPYGTFLADINIDLYSNELNDLLKRHNKNKSESIVDEEQFRVATYESQTIYLPSKNDFKQLESIKVRELDFGWVYNRVDRCDHKIANALLQFKNQIQSIDNKLYNSISKWYPIEQQEGNGKWDYVFPHFWKLYGLLKNSTRFLKIKRNKQDKIVVHFSVLYWKKHYQSLTLAD